MFEAAETGNKVSKEEYKARLPSLRVDLINAQYDLKSAGFAVVVLIVGEDRAVCDEIVDLLNEWMDGRYIHTHFFALPSDEQRQRPRFWRYWRALPPRGRIGLFMGAWTLNAIADRLFDRIDDAGFDRRIAHIRRFEQALADDGTLVLKYWLHIAPKELGRRIRKARKDGDSSNGWGVVGEDWKAFGVKEELERLTTLSARMVRKTDTAAAPWVIIDSADRRYRDLTIATGLLETLKRRLEGDAAPAAEVAAPPPEPVAVPHRGALDAVDLSASLKRDEYKSSIERLQEKLGTLVPRAAQLGRSGLLVFEGWDAAGKGGVIRRITRAVSARYCRVVPIAAPNDEERAHHYLWRFWRLLPPAGRLLIFDRSWYGRVLVERVEGFATEAQWRRAYEEINDFEEQLVEHGMPVLKFWLHVDPAEQLRRFEARRETPYKKYKLTQEDYRNREKWDQYAAAVNDMVERTSTEIAPWHLVAADDKRWARVEVLRTVVEAMDRALKAEG